ncbi:hypothetical protein ACN20G_13410 [Streptomyces sp. BI20]|uniref:hypothetical protein n=1 Tax=Streptomyces sp. BI20 TaxID=3403460 RepID=UPI003C76DEC0
MSAAAPTEAPLAPPVLGIPSAPEPEVDADRASLLLDLDASWPVFAEHFPGNPMFPGSASVRLLLDLARRIHPGTRGLRDVRFARPLVPPARARFTAERLADASVRVTAQIEQDDGTWTVAIRGEVT